MSFVLTLTITDALFLLVEELLWNSEMLLMWHLCNDAFLNIFAQISSFHIYAQSRFWDVLKSLLRIFLQNQVTTGTGS